MNKYIIDISDCNNELLSFCGGKAANLGELIKQGHNVPRGFVLTTQMDDINKYIELILAKFDDYKFDVVAVRSSATVEDSQHFSFAGQFDSFLFVKKENLINTVLKCKNSINNARIESYIKDTNILKKEIKIAVIVQEMIQSDISGVLFTSDPTGDDKNILLESIYGVGEYIVNGFVSPQSLLINRETNTIVKITSHRQNFYLGKDGIEHELSDDKKRHNPLTSNDYYLNTLLKEAKRIEFFFGKPQDIEWSIKDDCIYILQSRPITTINSQNNIPEFLYNCVPYITRLSVVQRDEIFRITANSILNINVVTIPQTGFNRTYYFEKKQSIKLFDRCLKVIKSLYRIDKHLQEYNYLTVLGEEVCSLINHNAKDYLAIFKKYIEFLQELGVFLFTGVLIDNKIFPNLKIQIEQLMKENSDIIFDTIATPTKLHDFQKYRLAICNLKINGYNEEKAAQIAKDFSHLNQYLFDEKILSYQDIENEISIISEIDAQKEIHQILSSVEKDKNWRDGLKFHLKEDSLYIPALLVKEYTWLRTDRIDRLRKIHLGLRNVFENIAIDYRLQTGRAWQVVHIRNMTIEEILNYMLTGEIPDIELIEKRFNNEYIYFYSNTKSTIITEKGIIDKMKIILESNNISKSTKKLLIENGQIAYRGIATGRVIKITKEVDLGKVVEGDIIVAFITMPSYTPQMKIAGGFITAEGGITSHAAIVARELKKPCIVGVSNCMEVLNDGDNIILDLFKGRILINNQQEHE